MTWAKNASFLGFFMKQKNVKFCEISNFSYMYTAKMYIYCHVRACLWCLWVKGGHWSLCHVRLVRGNALLLSAERWFPWRLTCLALVFTPFLFYAFDHYCSSSHTYRSHIKAVVWRGRPSWGLVTCVVWPNWFSSVAPNSCVLHCRWAASEFSESAG